jgi:hypothetical protein
MHSIARAKENDPYSRRVAMPAALISGAGRPACLLGE